MVFDVDAIAVVIGTAGFLAGYTLASNKRPSVITDEDLKRDLEYHRNLTDSLRQDVTDLRKKNNDLMEKNYELHSQRTNSSK